MINKYKIPIILVVCILLFITGYSFGKNTSETKNTSDISNKSITPNKKDKSYPEILIKVSDTNLYIGTDTINVNPFEGQGVSMQITKNDYPKLFGPFDNNYYITADGIEDKVNNKKFVFVINNITSHGMYVPYYGIIIDPEAQSVVYETPELLGSSSLTNYEILRGGSAIRFDSLPYYFNDSCTNCKLPVIEYVAYNPKDKKFTETNNKYPSVFKDLLKDYESRSKECHYEGKIRSVDEIIQMAGENVRCDDMLDPNNPKKNDKEYYITVGKFKSIMENIKQIVAGQNKSLLDN